MVSQRTTVSIAIIVLIIGFVLVAGCDQVKQTVATTGYCGGQFAKGQVITSFVCPQTPTPTLAVNQTNTSGDK